MTQRFEHCRLIDNDIEYLGRVGLMEDKSDSSRSTARAWDYLENEGWELVSVVCDPDGKLVHYFKRPVTPQQER